MSFVVVIVALVLLQRWGPAEALHRDAWFSRLLEALQTALGSRAGLAAALALPMLAVWLATELLTARWLGVPLFALELWVLLYSMGRGDLRADLDAYLERWRRGDLEAALRCAQALDRDHAMAPVDSPAALHGQMRRRLLYRGLERWFSVVFWFVLLGPAAALGYRLLQRAAVEPVSRAEARALAREGLQLADWAPARLLGLSFALVGRFSETMAVWRRTLWSSLTTECLLREYQQAAQPTVTTDGNWDRAVLARAGEELGQLMNMLSRVVVLWVTVLALLVLL